MARGSGRGSLPGGRGGRGSTSSPSSASPSSVSPQSAPSMIGGRYTVVEQTAGDRGSSSAAPPLHIHAHTDAAADPPAAPDAPPADDAGYDRRIEITPYRDK